MARKSITQKKVTVNLPSIDVDRIEGIAERHDVNRTNALIRAIRTADYIDRASAEGGEVIIRNKDGIETKVVFQ
ncbi:hypothetical protein [Rhodococcus rhodochrous]|uniref:hypothetical protein n=1 Tax=Rhodococcus rhodochrous TaxID=1829 RepID=UPI001784FF3C|nr:hypothetical protein [Rhodococcus rhodochrous]QOH59867.1 hypothetical protein C6Y44_27645 [Rhodococcus rhodochrous]